MIKESKKSQKASLILNSLYWPVCNRLHILERQRSYEVVSLWSGITLSDEHTLEAEALQIPS